MFGLFKKPQYTTTPLSNQKFETCYTCGLPIEDNPHLELFFKDFQGKIFSVHTHMNNVWKNHLQKNNLPIHINTNSDNCYDLENIKKKLHYSTYIDTQAPYQLYKKKN